MWKDVRSDGVCLLNFEIPDAAIVADARCARAAGMRAIVLNPAPARLALENPSWVTADVASFEP